MMKRICLLFGVLMCGALFGIANTSAAASTADSVPNQSTSGKATPNKSSVARVNPRPANAKSNKAAATVVPASAEVNSLNLVVDNKGLKVIFGLTQPVTYKTFTLAHPSRLAIDIKNARFKAVLDRSALKNTPITDIRIADHHETQQLRIVLDLTNKVGYSTLQLAPSEGKGQRLEINLFNVGSAVMAKQTLPTAKIPKALPQKAPIVAPTVAKAALQPVATSDTVDLPAPTKYAPEIGGARDIIVVIDPGHGGKDPGATGIRGIKEKNVVLAIAKKLQYDLNHEPGFHAYLTRTSDYFIPLRERLAIARQYKADMFVAIHADAFNNNYAQGASVYALSERGATSEAARWLANSENRSESLSDVSLQKKDEMLRSVLIDLAQTSTITTSLQIGNAILRQLAVFSRLHYHKVEQAAFVVLKSPDIPSLLVESGFLSNSKEERRLDDAIYQQKIAFAIMQGVKRYFINNPPRGTVFSIRKANIIKHSVMQGDTLLNLANHYGIDSAQLRKMNNLSSNKLRVGQTLVIPVRS